MNIFQNKVRQLAIKREEEEFDAFEKEAGGTFDDFVEMVETEVPGKPYIQVDFVHKDEEGYKRWCIGFDNLRNYKEIKREVASELKRGPRL